ncbi:hypothetical protein Dtox_3811 [Desulfofarcimen acetoxidans DSM 771]|uniref:Uncharacterized protein n=1 Tax=Desulfofarcimen acetoxidans (strain ATCC 49208 / DSM 771 / KCTC 5769 / VKM B-1644 / 5575) TaxID=485916 RepID=C8VXC0_DESAS|nr:hypothetical protein [Desulfofarcimen acetoxidans]ACV64516.1 hypothetical protein Dtox_3811 [Desulfofarcimen acetoxidans DSM 771]
MRSNISKFLIAIIPILAVFITYYLNHTTVDVRYTLSDKIPISDSTESIQQLIVKNSGKVEAKKIQVKIKAKITSCDIIKHSYVDNVKEQKTDNSLEIVYPELPPQGSFLLTLKSLGNGINKSDLEIYPSNGTASEALSRNNHYDILEIMIMIYWILLTILYFYFIRTQGWESKIVYGNHDTILKRRNSPFYITKNKWANIREEALKQKIIKAYFFTQEIMNSEIYKILNNNKPDYLIEDEWDTLKTGYCKKFVESYNVAVERYFSEQQILKLLAIPKPLHIPKSDWSDLQINANKKYIFSRKQYIHLHDYKSILKEINDQKPDYVLDSFWSEYHEFLQKILYTSIAIRLELEKEPLIFLQQLDLDMLSAEFKNNLTDRAYKLKLMSIPNILETNNAKKILKQPKPDWISTEDYELLLKKARQSYQLESLIKEFELKITLLKSIVNKRALPDSKPNLLSDEEWDLFMNLDNSIREQSLSNAQLKNKLTKGYVTVEKLKKRIVGQLATINTFLNDTTVLGRIEDYDNVFAPGNFENLKKLALLLNKCSIKN